MSVGRVPGAVCQRRSGLYLCGRLAPYHSCSCGLACTLSPGLKPSGKPSETNLRLRPSARLPRPGTIRAFASLAPIIAPASDIASTRQEAGQLPGRGGESRRLVGAAAAAARSTDAGGDQWMDISRFVRPVLGDTKGTGTGHFNCIVGEEIRMTGAHVVAVHRRPALSCVERL